MLTITGETKVTVGLDLGSRCCQVCVLDEGGEVIEDVYLITKACVLRMCFSGTDPVRIVLEVGTPHPLGGQLLSECGHEVTLANSRKLRLICKKETKSERVDAEYLARVGRLDPELLLP